MKAIKTYRDYLFLRQLNQLQRAALVGFTDGLNRDNFWKRCFDCVKPFIDCLKAVIVRPVHNIIGFSLLFWLFIFYCSEDKSLSHDLTKFFCNVLLQVVNVQFRLQVELGDKLAKMSELMWWNNKVNSRLEL